MSRELEGIRRDWTRLGAEEPLWAVCVDPAKRRGGWDDAEFLSSGAAEVDAAMQRLAGLGWRPSAGCRALDFGCGAGRLTGALARACGQAVGVDVSAPMLAEARRLNMDQDGVSFRLNTRPDLSCFADGEFHLVYTDLVLQHLPGALARGYLAEFTRVLHPGGAMVVGVPVRERATVKGLAFRWLPFPAVALAQRLLLGYPAPMRMHPVPTEGLRRLMAARGWRLAAADEYWAGDHWQHLRHYLLPATTGNADPPATES